MLKKMVMISPPQALPDLGVKMDSGYRPVVLLVAGQKEWDRMQGAVRRREKSRFVCLVCLNLEAYLARLPPEGRVFGMKMTFCRLVKISEKLA